MQSDMNNDVHIHEKIEYSNILKSPIISTIDTFLALHLL